MPFCVACASELGGAARCAVCGRIDLSALSANNGGDRYATTAAQEADLVAALRVDPRDEATRQVYADWLEQHGYELRARFLRIEGRAADDADMEVQLRALAVDTPIDRLWRAVASRAPVECDAVDFTFRCPKRWDSMAPTSSDTVRTCNVCAKPVYFCATIDEVRRRAEARECVAVDAGLVRGQVSMLLAAARNPVHIPMMTGVVAPPRPDADTGRYAIPEKRGLLARIKGLFGR